MRRRVRRRKPTNSRRKASRRLSANALKKFVVAESKRQKLREQGLSGKPQATEKVKAKEVEAGDEGNQLEKDIDHAKALKIQEKRLRRKLRKIREAQTKVKRRILKKI